MRNWLAQRQLDKDIGILVSEERNFFREKTRLAAEVASLKREVFGNYLKQGAVPPRSLIVEFQRARQDKKTADDRHRKLESELDRLKRMKRSAERGTTGSLVYSEKAKEILDRIREERIDETRTRIKDTTDDLKEERREKGYYDLYRKVEDERADEMEKEMDSLVLDFEREFLVEMMSAFPDDWEEVPESIKHLQDDGNDAGNQMSNY